MVPQLPRSLFREASNDLSTDSTIYSKGYVAEISSAVGECGEHLRDLYTAAGPI